MRFLPKPRKTLYKNYITINLYQQIFPQNHSLMHHKKNKIVYNKEEKRETPSEVECDEEEAGTRSKLANLAASELIVKKFHFVNCDLCVCVRR